MQSSSLPTRIITAFAVSGTKNTIPQTQSGITSPGQASYDVGFPTLTMTPIASGGVPPYGEDFNGILYSATSILQWASAGGTFPYNSSYSTSIGGYPKGAMLVKASGAGFWQSTTENNTTNPETGGSGWDQVLPVLGLLDLFFPVGAYWYHDTIDPNTQFSGTTWSRITDGYLLANAGGGNNVGDVVGAETVYITQTYLPSGALSGSSVLAGHNNGSINGGSDITKGYMVGDSGSSSQVTMYQSGVNLGGSGTAFPVRQKTIYTKIWKRTA